MASRIHKGQRKTLGGSHDKDRNGNSMDMHGSVVIDHTVNFWTHLPDHILRRLFIRLPVPTLFHLRSVCKQWKQLIDCPGFSRLSSETQNSERTNFLLLQMSCSFSTTADDWTALDSSKFALHTLNVYGLGMYNPFLRTWYRLPPSILTQGEFFCRSYHRGVWCIQLFSRKRKRLEEDELRILIHSPTSGWTKEVPNTYGPKLKILLSLVVDKETNNFKLITTGCADGECSCEPASCLHTQVYDSLSHRWTTAGNLPMSVLLFKTNGRSNVLNIVTGHHVYYMVSRLSAASSTAREESSDDPIQYTWTFLSFNLDENIWSLIDGDIPFTNVMHFRTIVCERNEDVIIAQLTSTSEYDWRASLGWKLRLSSWNRRLYPDVLTLIEIPLRPPQDERLPRLFFRQRSHRFAGSWAGQGDWIMFVSGSSWGHSALLYNISSKTWTVTEFGPKLTKQPQLFITFPFDLTICK